MKRLVLLVTIGALAGCPSTTPPAQTTTVRAARHCPQEGCDTYNGPQHSGIANDDAPAPVTSVQLPSGTTVEAKP